MGYWMKLLENLLNYNEELDEVLVNSTVYRTKWDYFPSCAIGFSFGTSSCNPRLATTMVDSQNYFGEMKMMAQADIFQHYMNRFDDDITCLGKTTTQTSDFESQITTRDVLELAVKEMEKRDINKNNVLYVAHPAHVYRVMKMGEKLGLKGVPFIEKEVFWSIGPDEGQIWTTSPSKYIGRELAARAILMKLGQF